MPIYIYRRTDGEHFEHFQSMNDDALTVCPETGLPVKRVITGGSQTWLKGGGWPGKRITAEETHRRNLAKDPLYTTMTDYSDKVEGFKDRTQLEKKGNDWIRKLK